jgi:hypothetical protein
MANTTNYNWETPDDTDLVKDGAAAIRTLGSSVDTTTKALNPSTTLGDIEYRSATANTNTRLPIGTTGQVLSVVGGVPAWATSDDANAIQNALLTTTGDTIYASGASTPARLGIGSTGQVLTVAGGIPSWATPAGGGGGMTFIQRSTFSNVANTGTTFDNVFTSSYETYFINIENIFSASAGDDLQMQLRYAGPTTQTSAYYMANFYANYAASSMSFQGSNNASQWTLSDNSGDTNDRLAAQFYVNQVGNTSERALINGQMINSNKISCDIMAGNAYTAQTYTGFLLKSSSANISGTITIFGVNKS